MLDDAHLNDSYVYFNTGNYKLHSNNDKELSYSITSTKTEQAAINSCDTTANNQRLQYAFEKYQQELSVATDKSKLKEIVVPLSDDKLQECCTNITSIVELNIATSLMSQTQEALDHLNSSKMSAHPGPKRFRKNK